MPDFHQEGIVTNLHALHGVFDPEAYLVNLERKLEIYSRHLRISLLLPCLHSEMLTPKVLDRILDQIEDVRYLHCVVVALGGAPREAQFREAVRYFGRLRNRTRDVKVVWVEGPRVQGIFRAIEKREISTGLQGKGQSVWMALGYIFAREDCDVIGLHDCDILTYDRTMLGRLLEPTANPNNDFEFCKGYYPRISLGERAMKGRVTRLFVTPLVDALEGIMHQREFLDLERFFRYHRTFNYPLAGEFSFLTRLARGINIAYDWGLEVSTLSEVYHRVIPRKIAQINLTPNYDHKHQILSVEDAGKGLHRMVVDIGKFFFNYMRSHGVPLDDPFVDMIQQTYFQNALAFIKAYSDDAEVNDLVFDRHEEELTARYFRDFLQEAWAQSQAEPDGTLIPSWNRVLYSAPEIYSQLLAAVEEDNRETGRRARTT
jgi:glucosyl-3-phosphoglycerate synthase